MTAEITNLLDFSEWTLSDIQDIAPLDAEQLAEMESNVTNSIDDMSQFDHVCMVVTYKLKIQELEQSLADK